MNPAIMEESCAATDLDACSGVMDAAPDAVAGTRQQACQAAGAGTCTYTAENPARSVSQAGCFSRSVEYCATTQGRPSAMDNNFITTICGQTPHPEWGIVGGCTYTPMQPGAPAVELSPAIASTPATCVATVSHIECAAGLQAAGNSNTISRSDQCGAIDGCEWREAMTQQEDCVARDKDACANVHNLLVGAADAMSANPAAETLCTSSGSVPGSSCTYVGRRAPAVDSNCHRDQQSCTGSCGQRPDYPSTWCAPGSFPAPPPPPQPDHAECGWKSIGDLIASTPGGFSGWGGAQNSPPCFQRMAVYQVGRKIGSRFIRDDLPVWQPDQGKYKRSPPQLDFQGRLFLRDCLWLSDERIQGLLSDSRLPPGRHHPPRRRLL